MSRNQLPTEMQRNLWETSHEISHANASEQEYSLLRYEIRASTEIITLSLTTIKTYTTGVTSLSQLPYV